ncbi:unnamed protein product [Dovyalis caffra]|uniref:N-acetyltransferase domain-containing protein n=1 Tax=Dovyalis caffra TaxID=77055 RepID=A0AAV1QZB9_9ROSI|nr:unnamed protein product [Dovyalis caffra]
MRKRLETSSSSNSKRPEASSSLNSERPPNVNNRIGASSLISSIKSTRSGSVWLVLSAVIIYSCYSVHYYQFENLPLPLTAEHAGKRGFSEIQALKHVKALTEFGPHPVGSDSLDLALQYVLEEVGKIKKNAYYEVDVEVDFFHAKAGANQMTSGLFMGKTLVYADLKHVVLRILPKFLANEAADNTILVSSHIDTVFSTGGAGDCSSCVAVMLELARGISQWAHGFKNGVIFLFNTGEEEGLNGAHSFITQHPWSKTIRLAVDLEAMGVGGKSSIFQAGPHPWAITNFASVAKYPSGHIIGQDLFSSGAIKSATDFQVYQEVAGLSGLDFAFTDNGAVYHTKNDKLDLLKSGSLQHLGENMLAFLLHIGPSPHLPKGKAMDKEEKTGQDTAIFFDILGTYMIVYSQHFASMLHNSVILQSLLIWAASLFMGGSPAAISLGLSCLSAILMWLFSISFSVLVALVLPRISSSPVPYVANPLLVLGLFAAPALLGALTGQHLGYLILKKYLSNVYSKRKELSSAIIADLIKLEAERWLYKAGVVQWLVLLIVGNYYKIGSSYLALFWLIPPAFAYGLLEATLTPARLPRPLKLATLLMGLAVPVVISAGSFIRLTGTVIGIMVRFDRNPGGTPEWLGNVMISTFIAVIICLTFVYILSYVHLSGAKTSIILALSVLFGLSLILVLSGTIPPFTEDTARAVNVVHVVDASGRYGEKQDHSSYISLFSATHGKLEKEIEQIKEGFTCGRDKQGGERITRVSIDTKSSMRWSLAINTKEIGDFILKGNSEELIPSGNKSSVDGWHHIQFSGGKESPRKFELVLFWLEKTTHSPDNLERTIQDQRPLLKLRTDADRLTPKAERVIEKLPTWCSPFGKSTSPLTLAFLSSLPVKWIETVGNYVALLRLPKMLLQLMVLADLASKVTWHDNKLSGGLNPALISKGLCKASQVVELFPTVSPEIVVREARIEDCWEVAETHCSSFFPDYSFPLDFVLRVDRLVAMLSGFTIPNGCRRTCLVAVIGSSVDQTFYIGSEDFKIGGFDGKFSLNRGYVAGILTVDTVADFLPRKGPLRQRRTGIAYISNVAVRERFRRKGIGKRLVAKAEAQARSWGCRSIALHCDLSNPGATKLYKGQGFKSIRVPEGANWPQPKTSPDVKFNFMMKLLNTPITT